MKPSTRILLCAIVLLLFAFARPAMAQAPNGPDPRRGLYAIWYASDPEKFLGQPYIQGGQIVLQWADVEPEPARYDFSNLDAQLAELSGRGLFTTIQINGNKKPDWLFERVPYLNEPLSVQVRDPQGTLMYWHPVHREAYLAMLRALAVHLRSSPHGDAILGIRMNLNAIGTEHHYIQPEDRPLSKWTVPEGVDVSELAEWSKQRNEAYIQAVMDTYVDSFRGGTRIFVRNGIPVELEEAYRPALEDGTLSWFHTSSEAEPRATFAEKKYQRFVDDCRSGKTTAYAEPWASTWGHHGGQTDDRWCSPPQWNYWRLLFDLHCGVSYIALYSTDMRVAVEGVYQCDGVRYSDPGGAYQREFNAAFDFASKYAGMQAFPEHSPGAWVAFRENDVVRAANGLPEERRRLSLFNSDYDFLMRRLPGDASVGLDVVNLGPEDQRFGAWARLLPTGESMAIALDERFAASLRGNARVNITYLDEGTEPFEVVIGETACVVEREDSRRWRTAAIEVSAQELTPDADGAHIVILAGRTPVHLHMVEVQRIAAEDAK